MGRKRKCRRSYQMNDTDIAQHYRLVHHIVGRLYPMYRCHLSKEDAEQAGMLGLTLAARYYRPQLGNKFSTYAYQAIYSQIINAVRNAYPIHVPQSAYSFEKGRQAAGKLSVVHLLEDSEELAGKETSWQDKVIHRLDALDLLKRIDPRSRRLLQLAMGINCRAGNMLTTSQLEGVGKKHIRHLKRRAYTKLRKAALIENYL